MTDSTPTPTDVAHTVAYLDTVRPMWHRPIVPADLATSTVLDQLAEADGVHWATMAGRLRLDHLMVRTMTTGSPPVVAAWVEATMTRRAAHYEAQIHPQDGV